MPTPITVMTVLEPHGVPRPHLYAGHLSPAQCTLCAEGVERDVPEGASVTFTLHTLYADVSADHGEIASYDRAGGQWVPGGGVDPNEILSAAAPLLPGVVCAPVRPLEERLGLHLPDGFVLFLIPTGGGRGTLAALGDCWNVEVEATPAGVAAAVRPLLP